MSDYTPTMRDMKRAYLLDRKKIGNDIRDSVAEFDRWLAAELEKARGEGYDKGCADTEAAYAHTMPQHDAEAYQRGREDAARAFLSALGEGTFDDALAAARGDGAE